MDSIYSQLFGIDGQLDTNLFQSLDDNMKSDTLFSSGNLFPQSISNNEFLRQPSISEHKQSLDWVYNPFDTFSPQTSGLFCDNTMFSNQPSFNFFMTETVAGGVSRGYVNLCEVNSFIAKAETSKSTFSTQDNLANKFLSTTDFANDDSEDDSDHEIQWPPKQKLTIKLKTNAPKGIKHRKSLPNIYSSRRKTNLKGRRGSAPQGNSITGLPSTSSVSSLAHKLTRSLQVSDHNVSEDELYEEYDSAPSKSYMHVPIKKGRNVDKACNHCKRSHLRCDEMRPCRRCISTGKTGCKDVEHKQRGRPKLYKH